MKFFIDECLSPRLATRLNAGRRHEAIHPLHVGRRGEDDHIVVKRCIAEDRVIVTENGRDFRRLIARETIHPGLIVMPCVDRETSWSLLGLAIAYLESIVPDKPEDAIVNHVLEIDANGICRLSPLP